MRGKLNKQAEMNSLPNKVLNIMKIITQIMLYPLPILS